MHHLLRESGIFGLDLLDRFDERTVGIDHKRSLVDKISSLFIGVYHLHVISKAALLFINGACSAGLVVTFAIVRENSKAHIAGSAMAFLNIGVISSGAVLQPLIGWLLDLNWDGRFEAGRRLYSQAAYENALWILPVSAGFAVILIMFMREPRRDG